MCNNKKTEKKVFFSYFLNFIKIWNEIKKMSHSDKEIDKDQEEATVADASAISADQDDGDQATIDDMNQENKRKKKERQKTITENDTYKCELCDYKTGYKGFFERHLNRHDEKEIKYNHFNFHASLSILFP